MWRRRVGGLAIVIEIEFKLCTPFRGGRKLYFLLSLPLSAFGEYNFGFDSSSASVTVTVAATPPPSDTHLVMVVVVVLPSS